MEENQSTPSSGSSAQAEKRQFNSFYLGDQLFGIEITHVKEIIRNHKITKVPHAPDYIRGVINLRGTIVTVTDPRVKLKMEDADFDYEKNRIIIIKTGKESEQYRGLLVDRISDVYDTDDSQREEVPLHLSEAEKKYISEVYKLQDELLLVIRP